MSVFARHKGKICSKPQVGYLPEMTGTLASVCARVLCARVPHAIEPAFFVQLGVQFDLWHRILLEPASLGALRPRTGRASALLHITLV